MRVIAEFKYPPQGTVAGTVIGPGSSTDNAIARFDGITGETIQNSSVTLSDSGVIAGATIVVANNTITTTASGNLAATELNAALAELQTDIDTRALASDLSNHIGDTTDAHDASAISSVASGNLSATDVQAALNELQADIDTRQTADSDLTAIAGLSTTGLIARTGSGTASTRTLTGPAAGISVTNGDGVSGNPTLALSNDLSALEGLSSTGIAVRTATDTWAQRSVAAGTGISVTNGDGVSGNPTVAIDSTVATLTGSQNLTNKTITSGSLASPTVSDYTLFTEASAPATPAAGKIAIYAKSDKKVYKKDSNGTESELGAGGTSAINYISNYDFETGATTGWATYKDAAATTPADGTGGSPTTLTLSANSSSPLRGSYDFKVAKSAANSQGEGFSYDFSIKVPDKSKKLSISFDLNTTDSNYTAGDVVVYVYDVTNAALITPSTTSLPKMSGTWAITFDSTTSTSYRLIFHWAVTTATAANLYFDNIVVGPGQLVQGAALSYLGRDTTLTTGGFGTNSSVSVDYWRMGNILKAKGKFTAGTVQAATATITLRDSLTADVGVPKIVGRWWRDNSSATTRKTGTLYCTDGATTVLFASDDYTTAAGPVAALNGDTVTSNTNVTYFDFEVPVAQWAGNGTVNLGPGAQVQYLYNSSGITAAGASDTTSFAYGPGGVAIGNIASTTANSVTSFRVRSLYPIQATDLIVLELDQGSSGARWFEAGMLRAGPIYQSTSIYGVYFTQINSTDLDVNFGNKGFVSNNAIYAGDGATWTSISTWRWRVRIVQPSSPVGYGLVDTNSSGLQRAYSSMTKIRLNTGNGYGSTSTCIRRFTNTVVNTGSGITYADSSTAGASFTCTEAGIYCFSYDDAFSAGANFGLSLNSSQLTTAINSITASDRLVMATTSAAAGFQCVSVTVALAVGDVVRPHADATTESVAPARVHFTVQRIA